ncbi:hypothetical protein EDB44_10460 [Vibrio crassostreae]|nr:hypothetical protein EDB44_10460 [Vibrio crassostreae]TCT84978.1 hypothetical protein EDB43_10460 [Vibrio crassostreae]
MKYGIEDIRDESKKVLEQYSSKEFQLTFCIEPHYQKIVDFLEI